MELKCKGHSTGASCDGVSTGSIGAHSIFELVRAVKAIASVRIGKGLSPSGDFQRAWDRQWEKSVPASHDDKSDRPGCRRRYGIRAKHRLPNQQRICPPDT